MEIAALLIIALVLSFTAKLEDKKSFRNILLAIFGISYFVVWKFVDFYYAIFTNVKISSNTAFLVLTGIVLLIISLPWVKRGTREVSYLFVVLFFLSVTISFIFEKNIKNFVAETSGYYSDSMPEFSTSFTTGKVKVFQHEKGVFAIEIPVSWEEKKNSLDITYFSKGNNIAELRPSCFHGSELTMPEIVLNIMKSQELQKLNTTKSCVNLKADTFACLVKTEQLDNKAIKSRWRWLVMDHNNGHNIELDFIFSNNDTTSKQEAEAIISSLELKPLLKPVQTCLRPAEWF